MFSSDARLVALCWTEKLIRIHELPSGALWKDLHLSLPVGLLCFHPEGNRLVLVGGNSVQLRDLSNGKELAKFNHSVPVFTPAWRNDGKVVATGCGGHDIYIWDAASPARPLRPLKGHFGAVANLAFSQGGDLFFGNSLDSTDRLWDTMTGQQLVSRPGGMYREYAFDPDDQGLADGWQVAASRECRTFHGDKYLNWVAISPGGRLMASVHGQGVQIWDLGATREGDKPLTTLPVGPSRAVHFDRAGENLITDSKQVGLQRWPITEEPQTGRWRIGPPQSLGLPARAPFRGDDPDSALSADGRVVARSPRTGKVVLFDRKYLSATARLQFGWPVAGHGNRHGRGVKIWDARTGKREKDLDLGELKEGTAWPAKVP